MNNFTQQFKDIGKSPSQEIKARVCDNLMYQIYNHERSLAKDDKAGFEMSFSAVKFAWRPVGIFALVVMLFMGSSGIMMAAAQNSTPGTKMFVVKRMIEKSQGLMVADSSQRVELASALLGNRVNELQKVMVQESQLVSADGNRRSEKVALAVVEVRKQLAEVDNELSQLKTKNESNKKTAVAALILNEKIRNYQNELKQIKEKVVDTNVDGNLEDALDEVGEINSNILEVIVAKQQQGDLEIGDEEIGNKLTDHVLDIEEKVNKIEQILAENTDVGNDDFTERTGVAKKKIEDARVAIEKNEFDLVLTLAKGSNDILKILYGEIYEVIENKEVVDEIDIENEGEVKGDIDAEEIITDEELIDIDKEVEPIVIEPVVEEVVEEIVEEFDVGIK